MKKVLFKQAADAYRQRLHLDGRLTKDTELRLKVIERKFANWELEDVTAAAVQQWVYDRWRNRSPSTVNRNVNVMVAIMVTAEELGMVKQRPKIRRARGGDASRDVHLEVGEVMKVVDAVLRTEGALQAFAILLLCDTGMRLNEALDLRWGDLSREWIKVRRRRVTGKTKYRLVPTSPRLIKFMGDNKILPLSTDTPDSRIILDRWNEPAGVVGRRLNHTLRAACVEVGARCGGDVRLHDLRHTFAYLCASSGADLGDIKELLGHSHTNVTMRYRGFVQTRAAEIIRKGMSDGSL